MAKGRRKKTKKRKKVFLDSKHKSTHHIIPTSRGGPKEEWNEYRWIIKKHRAYHQLSDNRLPSEFIKRIKDEWTLPNGDLDIEELGKRKFKAWQEVFSTWSPKRAIRYIWSPERAIQYIEKKFLPVEIRFLQVLEIKKRRKKKRES